MIRSAFIRWLSFIVGIVVLWLGAWIYLPAPTYALLTFSVGAPEISQWTLLVSLIGAALAIASLRTSRLAKSAFALNVLSALLALGVWIRMPGVLRGFDVETQNRIATPRNPMRSKPIVFADLFRGVPATRSRVSHRIKVGQSDTVPMSAEIYAPPRHGLFPIIVQIYGGAWMHGQPTDNARFASWLAEAGYVVVAIDYRHAPTFNWPVQATDVNDALKWVVEHATDYDGDTSRVVLLGRSAGAHLATYAAWIAPPIHLRGVVSLYGPADLVTSYKLPPSPDPIHVRAVEEAFIGTTLARAPDMYAAASPLEQLSKLNHPVVPSLLIYGGRDNIVEAQYGRELRDVLMRNGNDVSYLELPWADHAFDAVFSGPSGQITLYYVERFLARVMATNR